ncbi:17238_t:CDS:2 [Entrophospora sp. SA101]|nr:17238_t:CDS:2 [Entrophospora sp. SA101]
MWIQNLAFAKANSEAEKLLWERLVNDLKKIDLTQLPYNHPLYSGIFDIESSPISDLPDSLCNVFEENTKKKFCIDNNEALLQTCKEYIQEIESSKKYFLTQLMLPYERNLWEFHTFSEIEIF